MDQFSTAYLMTVVSLLNRPSSFLLDLYFPQIAESETETVDFDVVTHGRRLAPLVSPVVEGQVVQESGVKSGSVKPAYLKPKTPLAAAGALRRQPGEQIGGGMSAMDRQEARIARTLLDHIQQITRRKEWMAASVLNSGSLTLSGEKYPERVVDYGRNVALSITLTTTARWGEAGVSPWDDLQDWALLVLQHGGVGVVDVTMGVKAWGLFKADAKVEKQLDYRHDIAARLNSRMHTNVGGVYQGSIGGLNFYTYAEFYVDDAGATQKMIGDYDVIAGGPGLEGVQAHGAIQDDNAGFVAAEYFPTSWVPNDPPVRQVMTQSAPIIVPSNVNGMLRATVR